MDETTDERDCISCTQAMATVLFISKKGLAIIMPPKTFMPPTKKDRLFFLTLVYCTKGRENQHFGAERPYLGT